MPGFHLKSLPQTLLWELTALPKPPSWIWGKGKEKGGEGKGVGVRGRGDLLHEAEGDRRPCY